MSRIIEEKINKLKFTGGVDADGHIMEAQDLWEKYCDPKYRATAVRMKVDEQGFDYLEIGGRPSRINRGGAFTGLGSMGQVSRDSTEGETERGDRVWWGGLCLSLRLYLCLNGFLIS